MISQQWSGHPGRLVKSWDPVGTQAWPLGRGVYNVTCDPDDRTQTGWSFDSEAQEVRGPEAGTCLDWKAADNRQVWAVNCTGVQAQRWTLGPADDEGFSVLTTSQTHKALVIPGPQNSVGFGRKGDKQQTRFRLKDGQLQSNAGSCLAARAINPPTACAATSHVHAQACHTYELWAKPLRGSDWPSSAVAVLLVNNGLPANVSFSLPELGIRGGVSVRDVWAYRDAGTIEAGGERSIELGVHASALLVLTPSTMPAKSDDGMAKLLPETDWLSRAGHGVFTHYLSSLQNDFGRNSQGKNSSWDEAVDAFDVEAYATSAAETGARYAVLTLTQQSRFVLGPNSVYERFTGYAPGEGTSNRDLVLDVHAALAKRGLRLMLYWTCDGPALDSQAHEGLGWPELASADCPFSNCSAGLCECEVPQAFLSRWPAVLREYAVRYGDKVSGWWIDGCFRRPYGYNETSLKPYHDAVRAGNPHAILALNNGVHHPIGSGAGDRISVWEDYTAGESDDFTEVPASRFVSGPPSDPTAPNVTAQWHTLSFLGPQWAAPGACVCCTLEICLHSSCDDPGCVPLNASTVSRYTRAVNAVGGALTVDLQLLRNGSMNGEQVALLREAWASR